MTASILALGLAYVFLLFLLLLVLLRSEIGPAVKLVAAALSLGFYLWHYDAVRSSLGWPAADDLPEHFELVGAITVEPNLKQDEEGSIYLWLRDLDSDSVTPRAYRLDYRKPLHQKVDETLGKQRLGERHIGRPVEVDGSAQPGLEFDAVQRDHGGLKADAAQGDP